MLAVNVDQIPARLAQLRECHTAAVDERAGAAAAVDHAPHQARAVVTRQIVLGKPALQGCKCGRVEIGADLAFPGALPHDSRIAALTQHHRQSVDQYGFSSPGLAAEDRETGCELEIDPVDDHEITDVQCAQHRPASR
jgi:hypothetical protein